MMTLEEFRLADAAEDHASPSGSIEFGDYRFESRHEAKRLVQETITRVLDRGWCADTENFLLSVVQAHPEYQQRITIASATGKTRLILGVTKGRQLGVKVQEWLPRLGYNGEQYHPTLAHPRFSIDQCLDIGSHRSRVIKAARAILWSMELTGKRLICAICGEATAPQERAHLDHWPFSFHDIFHAWRARERLLCGDIRISASNSMKWADAVLEEKWRQYHDWHAIFRPTHDQCNLKSRVFADFTEDEAFAYDEAKLDQAATYNTNRH